MRVRLLLIEALEEIQKRPPKLASKSICHSLDLISTDLISTDCWHTITRQLFSSWKHFSGNLSYPVPCPKSYSIYGMVRDYAQIFHQTDYDMYEGEYGELRLDLIRHMLEQLRLENC